MVTYVITIQTIDGMAHDLRMTGYDLANAVAQAILMLEDFGYGLDEMLVTDFTEVDCDD